MPHPAIPREFLQFLRRSGLAGAMETPVGVALTGGVSSDIWKIETPDGAICVKRALGRLKVADEWHAPIERNAYEVAWMRIADRIEPGSAPAVLAEDAAAGMFAMPFMDPESCRLWKDELRQGHADPAFAKQCGTVLARIHGATLGDSKIAAAFPTDKIFHAIRLEPYLEATARRHPDVAPQLSHLVSVTAANKLALVHGDVSPKNILVTPAGPVFLDAECAWYGDPAFDLSFCLKHFLLKCLWHRQFTERYLDCFHAFTMAYIDTMDEDGAAGVGAQVGVRTARLLPGLFLARVDGKSPVEYVTDDGDKARVRRVAKALLVEPVDHPLEVCRAWHEELRN